MIVCVCNAVNHKTLTAHAQEGKSFDDLQIDLGVSTQCGKCRDDVHDIIANCQSKPCYKSCLERKNAHVTNAVAPVDFPALAA